MINYIEIKLLTNIMNQLPIQKYMYPYSGMFIANKIWAANIDYTVELSDNEKGQIKSKLIHSWWQLKEGDIVYVDLTCIWSFLICCGPDSAPPICNEFKTPVILILGSLRYQPKGLKYYLEELLKHENIKAIFMTNPPFKHDKLHYMLYGRDPSCRYGNCKLYDDYYKFYDNLSDIDKVKIKTNNIFRGYFTKANNLEKRQHINCDEKLPYRNFIEKMIKSKYVLSPDGDRPDQYRISEAIGLGCKPIVQMDKNLYNISDAVFDIDDEYWNDNNKLIEKVGEYKIPDTNFVLLSYWKVRVDIIHNNIFPHLHKYKLNKF